MGQLFSVFLLVVVGAVIALVAWWYVITVRDWLFASRSAYVLGEVEVVGQPELAETYKKVLPRIIIAQLARIRNESNDAIQSLREARLRRAGEPQPQSREYVGIHDLPQPFSEPIEVSLKIAEVDVGPLLGLLSRATQREDALEITASISPDGRTANVYGYLGGSSGYSFSEAAEVTPDSMAHAAAAAIVAEILKRQEPTLAALGAKEYSAVLEVLSDYARHLKRAPIIGDSGPAHLQRLNTQLRDIARQYSGWRDLQWLAAEIAEEAQAWEDAGTYYRNLLAMTPAEHSDRELVTAKLAAIEQQEIKLAEIRARAAGAPGADALEEQQRSNRVAAASAVEARLAAPVLRLLRMDEAEAATGQRIGIVGMPWPEVIEELRREGIDVELAGSAAPGQLDEVTADYITELVQTIRMVARDPSFVIAPLAARRGGSTHADLLVALSALGEAPQTGILLQTFSSPARSEAIDEMTRALSDRHAVVVPAGNQSEESPFSAISDWVFVAGAVTLEGQTASFSSTGSNLLWAPGAGIPVRSPRSGAVERRSGTAYSAAIAAGALAVLKHRFPDATPQRLRAVLAETATPVAGDQAPRIIDLSAAIEALDSGPEAGQAGG